MKTIPLTKDKITVVDDRDFAWANQFKWYAAKRGRGLWYAARNVRLPSGKRTTRYMHREIIDPEVFTDHKDGDGLNNQRYNLRECSPTGNSQAVRKKRMNCSSRFRGVSWHKASGGYWRAEITLNGKSKYLGIFTSEATAALARDAAAIAAGWPKETCNFPVDKQNDEDEGEE